MGEPYGLPGLDPMKTRWVLAALAVAVCSLLAFVPVDGIDPVTGARTAPSPSARADAKRAVAALEELAAAQSLLRKDDDGDGVVEYGTLADLHAASLISDDLADGRAHGYTFHVRPSATRPELAWLATAVPDAGGPTFVVNQDGLVHVVKGEVALDDGCAIPTSATRVGG